MGFEFRRGDTLASRLRESLAGGQRVRWEKECGQSWKRTAVTCTERCWYLADGDMFIKCAELCGCEVEEIVTERSGPPKESDDSPPQYCQSPQILENSTARYPESLEIRANRQSCPAVL